MLNENITDHRGQHATQPSHLSRSWKADSRHAVGLFPCLCGGCLGKYLKPHIRTPDLGHLYIKEPFPDVVIEEDWSFKSGLDTHKPPHS